MPYIIQKNTLDGFSCEETSSGLRVVNRYLVGGLSYTKGQNEDMAAHDVLYGTPGLPEMGSWHRYFPWCRVVRRTPRALRDDRQMEVDIVYESLGFGDSDIAPDKNVFTFKRGTVMMTGEAQRDLAGSLIVVEYSPPNQAAATTKIEHPVLRRTYVLQSLVFSGTFEATYAGLDAAHAIVDCVNDRTYRGAAVGRWLCTSFQSQTSDAGKTHSVELVLAKSPEGYGWMSVGVGHDHLGRNAIVADADMVRLKNATYSTSQIRVNGMTWVGLHQTANFLAAIGV